MLDFAVKLLSGLFFGFWLMFICIQVMFWLSKHRKDYVYWDKIDRENSITEETNPKLYEMTEKFKTMRTIVIYLICTILCMFITDIFI